MTSQLTLSPDDSRGLGGRSDRIRPGAKHSGDAREVLGVEGEQVSWSWRQETVDQEAMREFMRKHEESGVVRGPEVWKMFFDEFVTDRLQERDPPAFVRELCRRGLAPLTEEELGAATGGREVVVPDGESTEGRGVRTPTLPYVPTEKERREHNVTHYPHRTWCETCMSGRAVAGAHSRNKDESNPLAGEFHFDD